MRPIFAIAFAALLPLGAAATEPAEDEFPDEELGAETLEEAITDAEEDTLPDPDEELLFLDAREIDVREFVWERRIIVVMANTPNDPLFERQIAALADRGEDFVERDVVVIFDTDPDANSPLRQVMRPRAFMTAIIDKDGEVKARRPAPRTGRELMAVIDRFPLRRQEQLERNPAGR